MLIINIRDKYSNEYNRELDKYYRGKIDFRPPVSKYIGEALEEYNKNQSNAIKDIMRVAPHFKILLDLAQLINDNPQIPALLNPEVWDRARMLASEFKNDD